MKTALLFILLAAAPVLGLLTRVRDRNIAVATGRAAYLRGDAPQAAEAFAAALAAKARRVPDPRLILNLGHAQFRAGQLAQAQRSYERLLTNVPPAVGSVARQQLAVLLARRGQAAQALGLLRQALVLDPNNRGARYNYEVLSSFLNRQSDAPAIPPPAADDSPSPDAKSSKTQEKQPSTKEGSDRRGEVNKPESGEPSPQTPPESRPDAAGQPDKNRPGSEPGNNSPRGLGAGAGPEQAMPEGQSPGTQQGLDRSGGAGRPAATGRSTRPGSEGAAPEDLNLQTQRERLRAMNLSPAQARQLLEALRAQEQQYLQQLARPAPQKPDPNKPSW